MDSSDEDSGPEGSAGAETKSLGSFEDNYNVLGFETKSIKKVDEDEKGKEKEEELRSKSRSTSRTKATGRSLSSGRPKDSKGGTKRRSSSQAQDQPKGRKILKSSHVFSSISSSIDSISGTRSKRVDGDKDPDSSGPKSIKNEAGSFNVLSIQEVN